MADEAVCGYIGVQGSAWLEVTRPLFSQQVIYSLCGTRTWKAAHPRFTEADLQPNGNGNPDLGVRRGVWNIRKLLRDGGWQDAHSLWKEAELYSQTETRIQTPGLGARRVWNMRKPIRDEKVAAERRR